uniref:GDNF domain-containing protein n=1 Tax=Globodera pallida TaxID=36090 RepID=A0A183BSW4_GLOPA
MKKCTTILFITTHVMHSMAKTTPKAPRSELVAYEDWNCGATSFDSTLSHQMAQGDCPKRMFETDLCCRVHDMCYMEEHRSRDHCDEAFCYCLERTVAQPTRNANQTASGCSSVSTNFCEIIKLFGGIAYSSSRDMMAQQKKALEAEERSWKAMLSSTTAKAMPESTTSPGSTSTASNTTPLLKSSTSTSTPSSVHSTASPAEIGQFVTHKLPLECFDNALSTCTRQLHQCVSEQFGRLNEANERLAPPGEDVLLLGVQFAECSAQFCACSAAESARARQASVPRWLLGGEQCARSLGQICSQFQDVPSKQSTGPTNVHFWSVSVNYTGFSASLGLVATSTLFLSLLVLVLLGRFCSKALVRSVRKRLYGHSIRKHYDGGDPLYLAVGKESTASSPTGDGQQQFPSLGQHPLFSSTRTSRAELNMPLVLNSSNSSQVRLLSGSGNSSSTLSDVCSTAS